MTTEQVDQVIRRYGLQPLRIHAVQKGYRNQSYAIELPDRTLNLIVYKSEPDIVPRIRNAHYVSCFLANQEFKVRQPVDDRILRVRGSHVTKHAALYTYLPGSTIPWEAYTMKHLKQLGRHLGSIHSALRHVPQENLPAITDELLTLNDSMQRYFARHDVRTALSHKLGVTINTRFTRYDKLLRLLAGQPGAQTLHMDFVRGNVLFDEHGNLCGVLDFEKAAWGLPMFDVARTLAFLLVDCKYKSEEQVRKYFLRSGYNNREPSRLRPERAFEALVEFFLLHDLYKLLRHNPYESLPQNEHYVRTRNYLLGRNIISLQR